MSITNILVSIWDRLSRIWVLIRNIWMRNHTLFLGFAVWLAIRLASMIWARILTRVYSVIQSVSSASNTAADMRSGFSAWDALSLCNAVLPLQEALVLGALLLTVKVAFMTLNFIRYVYKQIPFKAS